jgi:glycosyltransferase involved in cell wall biosynthesis
MKVAIIVPTYNSAETLAETLESLQAQTGDLSALTQVYIADDCSRDETGKVAAETWQHAIPLTFNVNEKNLVQWGNVNNAINKLADSHDWVLILHSDDVAKPHWFSAMFERMQNCAPEVATISSSWDVWLADGTIHAGEEQPNAAPRIFAGAEGIRETMRRGSWWHISGGAIRTRAFGEIGEFVLDLMNSSDWEWSLRCLKRGWNIEYIPRSLVLYRLHEASVSSNSMNIDRDIRERLVTFNAYADYLTKSEAGALHREQAGNVLRRMARAVTRLRFRRVGYAWQTLGMVLRSWRKCRPGLRNAP